MGPEAKGAKRARINLNFNLDDPREKLAYELLAARSKSRKATEYVTQLMFEDLGERKKTDTSIYEALLARLNQLEQTGFISAPSETSAMPSSKDEEMQVPTPPPALSEPEPTDDFVSLDSSGLIDDAAAQSIMSIFGS